MNGPNDIIVAPIYVSGQFIMAPGTVVVDCEPVSIADEDRKWSSLMPVSQDGKDYWYGFLAVNGVEGHYLIPRAEPEKK